MKRTWLAWLVFGVCAVAMLAVMAWGSRRLLQLEASEKNARQEAALEENMRLALWRMETAVAPLIVRENSRPYSAYLASGNPGRGASIQRPGAPAPLSPASPYVRIHFEIDPARFGPGLQKGISALANADAVRELNAAIPRTWIRVDEFNAAPPALAETTAGLFVQAAPQSSHPTVSSNASQAGSSQQAAQIVQQAQAVSQRPASQNPAMLAQMSRNSQEFEARDMLNSNNAFVPERVSPSPVPPGPLVVNPGAGMGSRGVVEVRTGVLSPVWVGNDLLLVRHVQIGSRELLQGCGLDWSKVRTGLLGSIGDLLPGSDLVPERGAFDPAEGRTLSSLPIRLVPGRVPLAATDERSPMFLSLTIAWVCVLVAILSVGLLLMGAISLGQRRAAFVSSVTHELRSPLTTFRMYTEMLAEGIAADPAKQSEYHQTLRRESDRLVHLVENVLAYARLEKGRYGMTEPVPVGALIDRVCERLTEHARLAGMQLELTGVAEVSTEVVRVDVAAIERILFNLVDNACKYARTAADNRIHVEVERRSRWVQITVRDHGPGLVRRKTGRLFKPFRKSANEAAKSAPGVGIGLALSRRLAAASGGRLAVVDCEDGARLRLDLPLVAGDNT